jgi:hypothetical protein
MISGEVVTVQGSYTREIYRKIAVEEGFKPPRAPRRKMD